jgi:UDP-N-acetyl-D-mannosaminuronate dehydrogenase
LNGAAAVIVATEWPLYASIDWSAARDQMAGDLVIDARGVVDVAAAQAAGLRVVVHGRPAPARSDRTSGARQR